MTAEVICIVPALDADATVGNVVKSIRRALPDALVVGVDDGSRDGTRSLLRSLCDHTIEFDINRGKGAALRAAFAFAANTEAKSVITIDSDGQHDPAFAPMLLEGLERADLVIGARTIQALTVPIHRRLANVLSTAAARAVIKVPLRDSQSGFRAMRIRVIRTIEARGDRYEFETDFLVRAAHAGFHIAEVPVPTIYGPPSHFRELTDAWRVTRILWSHRGALFRPRGVRAHSL